MESWPAIEINDDEIHQGFIVISNGWFDINPMRQLIILTVSVLAAPFSWGNSSGTGFFVSSDGHMITNNHVIENCERISFFAAGASFNATVLATDNVNDLALLGSEYPNPMHLHVGQAEPSLMEEVFVAGYPFGDAVSSTLKVTRGIVSSLAGIANNYSNIQIDAAIQPGNSGGPIVNSFGEVVAVAVSKLDARAALQNFGALPEGVNFGIKGLIVGSLLSANQVQSTAKLHQNPSTRELADALQASTVRLVCANPVITPERANPRPNQDPTIKGIAERAIYEDAIVAMRLRDYAVSETLFNKQLKLYPGGNLAPNAIFWLGELHLNNGKLDKALEQFATITAVHSGSSKVPDAMFKTGVVLQRMGKEQEARAALERCFVTFPESPAGALAKKYLEVMDM